MSEENPLYWIADKQSVFMSTQERIQISNPFQRIWLEASSPQSQDCNLSAFYTLNNLEVVLILHEINPSLMRSKTLTILTMNYFLISGEPHFEHTYSLFSS